MNHFERTRLLVENMLRHPFGYDWSVQGLGMMRVYLRPNVRLHVWDRALLVPGASPLHTHPWDFTSTIVAGRMLNRRYMDVQASPGLTENREVWNEVLIQCGEGAHLAQEPKEIVLVPQPDEHYTQGDDYRQVFTEIHWSMPEDGTVTICERTFKEDKDHAFVFWRGKGGWVDAKPRPATKREVHLIASRSLETWF